MAFEFPAHFDPKECANCDLWKRNLLKDVRIQCKDTCVFKEIWESPDDESEDEESEYLPF